MTDDVDVPFVIFLVAISNDMFSSVILDLSNDSKDIDASLVVVDDDDGGNAVVDVVVIVVCAAVVVVVAGGSDDDNADDDTVDIDIGLIVVMAIVEVTVIGIIGVVCLALVDIFADVWVDGCARQLVHPIINTNNTAFMIYIEVLFFKFFLSLFYLFPINLWQQNHLFIQVFHRIIIYLFCKGNIYNYYFLFKTNGSINKGNN